MKLLAEKQLNIIRGKVLAGHASKAELLLVFGHLDALERKLDEADEQDALGTEGWRHFVGLPEDSR